VNPDLPPIRSVYQPIVDLGDGGTVGYECLVRGAVGAELATPPQLFGWAARNGRLAELDWACRISALRGALDGGLPAGTGLFINVEPAAFSAPVPAEMADLVERATAAGLRVVAEVTERSLAADPAALLRFADTIRAHGWALAVDDVGADIASLALMPFLAPEIVKLDLRLIQDRTTVDVAQIVNAVNAHAGREGALVLAEGIETPEHEELARSMGAHLGQGWLYGRPEPMPAEHVARPLVLVPPRRRWSDLPDAAVPWDLVKDDPAVRQSRKPLLAAMSRHLERQALTGDPATVVVGSFQRAEYFTPATSRRFAALATTASMVAVFGAGMAEVPVTGVRGHDLVEDDELIQEWTIAVVGPHFAAALVARDLGDASPEAERRFAYLVTYDRDTVVDAAAVMMRRLRARQPDVDDARALGQQPSRMELLTRAVSAATNGIVIADVRAPDVPLIYANAGFERLSGYPAEEILGRNCRFLQGPGTDPAAARALAELVRSHTTGSVTLLNYRRDGRPWWNEVTLSPMRDAAGVVTHVIGVQQDVTARVRAEAEVQRLGATDALTGVANRASGMAEIDRLLEGPSAVGLLFCDLDGFKGVNDRHGHVVGDELLATVARALDECLVAGERVFRYGGDEFVVVVAAGVEARIDERVRDLGRRVEVAVAATGGAYGVGISTGTAVADATTTDATTLLDAADRAMYLAKRGRRSLVS
jgi:diguanylate cyclase (GGDEF)-like protein/PAS domain S-box-containing protein